jgi:hypothetical protein
MKSLVTLAALLFTIAACDRPLIRPKGSDSEWQQRQEQMRLDEQQAQEQEDREVRVDHGETIDPIKLNPANN